MKFTDGMEHLITVKKGIENMKNKADMRRDHNTNEVVVYDENGKEVFRKPYTEQFISIANPIYMYHKYKHQHEQNHRF